MPGVATWLRSSRFAIHPQTRQIPPSDFLHGRLYRFQFPSRRRLSILPANGVLIQLFSLFKVVSNSPHHYASFNRLPAVDSCQGTKPRSRQRSSETLYNSNEGCGHKALVRESIAALLHHADGRVGARHNHLQCRYQFLREGLVDRNGLGRFRGQAAD